MPTVIVSTPIPFIGDPEIFEIEPFIVLAGKPLKVEYESSSPPLEELYRQLSQTCGAPSKHISPAQKKSLLAAAALKAKRPEASAVFVSRATRHLLGKEWHMLLPLVYASYTNACVAAKKSEDPVIIFRSRFLRAETTYLEPGHIKKAALATSVTDVISHAVGRLTVEAARSLRRRDIDGLATCLNTFSSLLLALFEHDKEMLRLQEAIANSIKKGYRGCAYIPTLRTMVKI